MVRFLVIPSLLLVLVVASSDPVSGGEVALSCNGSIDYCSLPYDRYTFAGTHNSAAYKLTPDCGNISKCKKAKDICLRMETKCKNKIVKTCIESTSKCQLYLPTKFGIFCTGWKSVCTKFSDVCEATEEVCVKPVSICTNGIPRLCKNIPEWMRRCLWENQHEHDIGRQLEDGIRAFDIDTCVTNDGTVVTCHGKGPSRALGAPLDEHLMEIRDFLEQNPRELVTLEYNDYDGDIVLDGMAISEAINKYLPDKLYSHGGPDDPWPTLGELLKQGKQVVMFFGNQLHSLPHDKQPLWGNDRYAYYESTWNYTNTAHDDDAVIRLMYSYAASNKANAKRWQCLDFEYSPSLTSIASDVANLEQPAICLKRLAKDINTKVDAVAMAYSAKFERIHRVRADYYYHRKEKLLEVVKRLNARNLEKYRVTNQTRTHTK